MSKLSHVADSTQGSSDAAAAAVAGPGRAGSDRAMYLAVDIGGTTTRVGLVDGEGNIRERRIEPTRRGTIVELASRIEEYSDTWSRGRPAALAGIGLSLRGIIDGNANDYVGGTLFRTVEGVNLAHIIASKLGLPVRVENDVNAAALAELRWGNGTETFCYVNVGTGIGAALVQQGRLLPGATMRAGEIADFLVPQIVDGSLGLRTLESLVSGQSLPALVEEVFARMGEGSPITPGVTGLILKLRRSYDDGSHAAAEVVDILTGTLAHAIFNVESIANCQTYVFGGGLFTEGQWLVRALEKKVRTLATTAGTRWDGKLRLARLPMEDIGLMGAAALLIADNRTEHH